MFFDLATKTFAIVANDVECDCCQSDAHEPAPSYLQCPVLPIILVWVLKGLRHDLHDDKTMYTGSAAEASQEAAAS